MSWRRGTSCGWRIDCRFGIRNLSGPSASLTRTTRTSPVSLTSAVVERAGRRVGRVRGPAGARARRVKESIGAAVVFRPGHGSSSLADLTSIILRLANLGCRRANGRRVGRVRGPAGARACRGKESIGAAVVFRPGHGSSSLGDLTSIIVARRTGDIGSRADFGCGRLPMPHEQLPRRRPALAG